MFKRLRIGGKATYETTKAADAARSQNLRSETGRTVLLQNVGPPGKVSLQVVLRKKEHK